MKPHIALFDEFLIRGLGETIAEEIENHGFQDIKSEWDGVTYPGICPLGKDLFSGQLARILNHTVEPVITFARITSSAQPPAPNQIHPDTVMSQYALLIYWSQWWPPHSGTSFWEHIIEGRYHTELSNHERLRNDSNDRTRWREYFRAEAKHNRALLYDSRLFHCAEPVGGFGKGPEDGRIVITSFFNLS